MNNPYVVNELIKRGVNKEIARKMVKHQVIADPVCVDALSAEDINSLVNLVYWLEDRNELEIK